MFLTVHFLPGNEVLAVLEHFIVLYHKIVLRVKNLCFRIVPKLLKDVTSKNKPKIFAPVRKRKPFTIPINVPWPNKFLSSFTP